MKRVWFFSTMAIISTIIFAQDYQISFAISGDNETVVDSVVVSNIEQGNMITILGNDVLHLIASTTGITDLNTTTDNVEVYPNPFSDRATIVFQNEKQGLVQLSLLDMSGKIVVQNSIYQSTGKTIVEVRGLPVGAFVIQIITETTTYSEVILSNYPPGNSPEIIFKGLGKEDAPSITTLKSSVIASEVVEMPYNAGETLSLTAYLCHLNTEIKIIPVTDGIISFDFHPNFFNGTVSSTETSQDSVHFNYENPFQGVELHNPTHLALIKKDSVVFNKKSTQFEEDPSQVYGLFELLDDSLQELSGVEGNQISFRGIRNIKQIDNTWMLYYGDDFFALDTYEKKIDYSYQVKVDTIFMTDTISLKTSSFKPYSNRGDSIWLSTDTLSYRDTLWVQVRYRHRDTIQTHIDTSHITKTKKFQILLLHTSTGNIYNIEATVNEGRVDKSEIFIIRDDVLYFQCSSQCIAKVDLNDLTFETIQLPYAIEPSWTVVEGNIFFFNYNQFPKAFCYKPGQGLITKSNIGFDPDIGSIWDYEQSPHVWIRGVQGDVRYSSGEIFNTSGIYSLFSLSLENDSMVFIPITIQTEFTTGDEIGQYFGSSIGDYCNKILKYRDERWFFNITDQIAWTYNSVTDSIEIFDYRGKVVDWEVLGNMEMVDGQRYHYSLYNNSVYRLDIEVPSINKLFDMFEMDIESFNIGTNSNFFVSGIRFSDLNNVTVEYDGATGAKLNEWVQENAPLETKIVYLTPITF